MSDKTDDKAWGREQQRHGASVAYGSATRAGGSSTPAPVADGSGVHYHYHHTPHRGDGTGRTTAQRALAGADGTFRLTLPRPRGVSPDDRPPSTTVAIPINIDKSRRRSPSALTPLTAREEKPSFFPLIQNRSSRTGDHSSSFRRENSPLSDRHPSRLSGMVASSSPFSSTVKSTTGASSQARGKQRDTTNLRLSNLPRYHPANFQAAKSSRPASQQKSHASETQKKLQMYQREIVRSATLASQSANTGGTPRPDSPQLVPLGSPGPITPFMLEDMDRDPFATSFRNPESPLRTPTQEGVR